MTAGLPIALMLGLGASCAILLLIIAPFFAPRAPVSTNGSEDQDPTFLIRGDALVDCNESGRILIEDNRHDGTLLDKLMLTLVRDFDDVPSAISASERQDDICVTSRDGMMQLSREVIGDAVRLRLISVTETEPGATDVHRLRAMRSELETLRANTMTSPFLLWRINETGEPNWVNQTYLDTVAEAFGEERRYTWPLPSIFPILATVDPGTQGSRRRLSLKLPNGETRWFDCHITQLGSDRLISAFRADEAVRAEIRRTEFTQTLTKTFADLAIGLAIFDRARRLVLFNPALTDLTNLPADFLISRPSLATLLDRLRESRMMPEPRDYTEWRRSIADIEAAAARGSYSELWSLPDGQTYRVTGHPHPDGAVALLFEDISAEISLTRRFREELKLSQSVINAFDDAVCVFSSSGEQIVCNDAYRTLWGMQAQGAFLDEDVISATRVWHERSTPTPIWGELRDFVYQGSDREEWTAVVTLLDGRELSCRFLPQISGATLAIFSIKAKGLSADDLRKVG